MTPVCLIEPSSSVPNKAIFVEDPLLSANFNLFAFTSPVKVVTPETVKVSDLTCVVEIPGKFDNPEPSPLNAVAFTVPVTVIPAVVVSNLSVLFHFKTAAPPFVNVA